MKKLLLLIPCVSIISCQNNEKTKTIIRYVKINDSKQTKNNKLKDSSKFNCYDGSQLEMNVCSSEELEYYDSILNISYKKLIQKIDNNITEEIKFQEHYSENLKKSIIQSQKDWIKFKESNRNIIEKSYNGGSMLPLAKNSQTIKDTKERIIFLNNLSNR
jgi:uncharacterized protein YecT (DUF1311 family)